MLSGIPKSDPSAASPSKNKGFFIAALPEPGSVVLGQLAVLRKERRSTRQNKPFLSLELGDRTGEVEARDFDHAEEHDPVFETGAIVKVQAKVDEYQGEVQLLIIKARTAREDEVSQADFMATTPYDIETMFDELCHVVEGVADDWVRKLLDVFLSRYAAELKASPAAMKLHHAYLGGLLEHTLSMCRAACALCGHYARLNRSLLIAGCILHDAGKIRELTVGPALGYTPSGRLVGHIAEGLLMLEECCRAIENFPGETRMVLRHMIVSHHGEFEYGALKLPMTPEAIALHFIDNMDAMLDKAFRLIDSADEGAVFSAYERSLGREIYRGEAAGGAPGEGHP